MTYRGFDIREVQVRRTIGRAVHDSDGMLLYRCGDEAAARAKIDWLISGDGHGTRPDNMRGA